MLGSVGSMTSEQTAMFSSRSEVGPHEAPASVLLNTPPDTPAASMNPSSPSSPVPGPLGEITSARVRPPTFPGPIARQPSMIGSAVPSAVEGEPRSSASRSIRRIRAACSASRRAIACTRLIG
jgi:hypothetical protein